MRNRLLAASSAVLLLRLCANAAVPVVQYEAATDGPTTYAPIDFGGVTPVTETSGQFNGITFHAIEPADVTNTLSGHATIVGGLIYGSSSVGNPYVTDVYCENANDFLNNTVAFYTAPGVEPVPGTFPTGALVVNNSYIGDTGNTNTDLDGIRRMDFMINRQDVTFVVAAVGAANTSTLDWSCFNSLGVGGQQSLSPTGGIAKQHADLWINAEASFGTAEVSGYAASLYGHAQSAGQADAQHSFVIRSLLMSGTDKYDYVRPSVGALDPFTGAGDPNYDRSLATLQGGEKTLLTVGTGSAVTGTPATVQAGWSEGSIAAAGQSVVLFQSANTITGLSASLNWNITFGQPSSGYVNTSTGAMIFPNLTVEVRPVSYNFSSGKYVLGASESSTMFQSAVSGDNTQYLYSTTSLPAGTYAFLIGGDPLLSATAGFSYTLSGSFASQWNSSSGSSWGSASKWTNGIPNGQGAQANLLSSPGLSSAGTITLDGDRTVGQLNLNNTNGYTIATGTSGVLTFDDTGDSSGIVYPAIHVMAGSHTISAPVNLTSGLTAMLSSGTALNISGTLTGSGDLNKTGSGNLTLSATDSFGNTNISAGTLTLAAAGSINAGTITVSSGANLIFAASTGSGLFARTLVVPVNLNGSATLATASASGNRQLLTTVTNGFTLAGTTNAWTGKLDLTNNDLDLPGASLAITINQIKLGFNLAGVGGQWNGSGGITSSTAAANTTHLTALGVIQNNQSGGALFTASNPFDGTTPGTSDILVKYTYFGDANLDGKVDGSDYSRIDAGFISQATGWYNGDFNYDGVINGSDYTLIDNAFNTQGSQISAAVATVTAQIADAGSSVPVPEPATLGLLGVGALGLLGRRSRLVRRSIGRNG